MNALPYQYQSGMKDARARYGIEPGPPPVGAGAGLA